MLLRDVPFSAPEDTLRKASRLVDEETGIIRTLYEAPVAPDAPAIFGCGTLCSDYGVLGYPSETATSGSTSLSRNQAIAGAIGEAVERYSASFVPFDDLVIDSYASLDGSAIAPWSLTLYDDEQYAHAAVGYEAPGLDTPIGWVSGYSLSRGADVLVPAFAVYQPYRSRVGERPVVQQITTGLASGNTLEEAVLSAICEVVERDAAMLTWLQWRQPPKVSVRPGAAPYAAAALARFRDLTRYVTLLDITSDFGIPAYLAVWYGPIDQEHGGVFASCANLDAERAAVGALNELAQCLMWAGSLLDTRVHVPDPSTETLSSIEDHVLWPLRAASRSAFEFVRSSTDVTEVRPSSADAQHVLGAIQACVRQIAERGLEVVVVDVTSPDVRDAGLHVVRAIVPGAQPLFFGTGLHRISLRARTSAYSARGADGINLHPHPFP